jgi:hypothetical protein
MIEINEPLPLLSAKLLGVGIEIEYRHSEKSLCLTIEAIAFKWCKTWGATAAANSS